MKLNLLLIALIAFGYSSAQQPDKSNLVQRNRNAGITFIKDNVYQDNKIIGGMQMAQGTENGQIVKTFSIYSTEGFKIAEAKCYGSTSHEWHIVTLKDNHAHVLTSGANNDAVDVIKYLIKGWYL